MSEKILLIDGHSILNRAFYGLPDLTNAEGKHTGAVYGFLNILFRILEEEKPQYLTVAFDLHEPTFRHKMYEAYKGTRKPMPEELREQVPLMKEMLTAMGIKIVSKAGYEADDLLGTLAVRSEKEGMDVTILSGDRDLLQLATEKVMIRLPKTSRGKTTIENFHAAEVLEKYQVTPPQIIELKALMGDSADNIPGIPGVGEKTATKMIVQFGSIENAHEHLEEVKPNKAKESLREHYDLAQLSKELATINTDSPLEFSYENNIDELKTCVTSSCAGAYLEKNSDGIAIHSYHLPEYMLSSLKLEVEDKDKRMIHLNSYSRDTSLGQTVQYFQIMLDVFEDYRQDMLSFDGLMMEFRKQLNDYYDYLIYGQKLVNIKISTYEQLINQIFENVGEMYGISLSKKYSHLLARRLYIQLQGDHLIDNWMKQNHDEIEEMFQAVSAVLEKESVICSRIVNLIKLNLDIEADSLNQLFLLLDIKNQNQKIQGLSAAGIILSHGYATASSIADAANQIIGRKVFDAIDMPLDMQMSDITGLLEKHIERFITCQDVVLLVDMGSLEQIHSQMRGLRNLNIGIINNISTALAVDIGLGICGNQKLEDILKRASESNVCTYRIIHNVQKEDAVIFSGENGIDTTEKLKELILKTSATSIPVKFVAYDYYRLMKNGSHDEIFQQYHVKCIIGLFNPEIEGIPFISLEDIISMNSAEKLTNIFSEYLDEEQMEIFNQNLVKNFSLQNVVESITILNPDKLLDEVEQAVGRLQKITGRKIAGRIMIGLYVHLCCLVERLVTKTPIDNYQDLEEFEQKHADFIRQVRDSFQDISRHYRVALPVSEIAYIYDYMHLNSKNKLSGQAESPAVREDE